MRRLAFILATLASATAIALPASAQQFPDRALQNSRPPAPEPPPLLPAVVPRASPSVEPQAPQESDAFDALLRKLVLELLPQEYVDDDDWGKTHLFTTGWDVERDGLKIETHRRREPLNHGTWERYTVSLADDAKFDLQVNNRRTTDDGRVAFDVQLQLPLRVVARQAEWRRGVQLYSVHADAEMLLRIELECVTSITVDTVRFPPAVVMKPEVAAARARLADFRLIRVSKVGGDVAAELGRAARGRIERRIAAKDEKLTRKINEGLAKRQDALRLSWAALAETGWKQFVDLKKPSP